MAFYFEKTITDKNYDQTIEAISELLKTEGFGVVTTIDFQATFKNKLGVDIPRYTVLGACNPGAARKALQLEPKIGVFLPCNIVVEENREGTVEIAIVDPVASMMAVENEALIQLAEEIGVKLKGLLTAL
jgi:uncharacterized protein (DUF302 family)